MKTKFEKSLMVVMMGIVTTINKLLGREVEGLTQDFKARNEPIRVVSRGGRAYTDMGNLIVVPNSSKEGYWRAAIGFVLHEVSHLLFTEKSVVLRAASNPLRKKIHNILEDGMIETRIKGLFWGAAARLDDALDFFKSEGKLDAPTADTPVARIFTAYVLYRVRTHWLGQEALADVAMETRSLLEAELGRGFVVKLNGMLGDRPQMTSADALALTDRIIAMLKEEQEKKEEEQKQQQQSQQGQDDSDDDQADDDSSSSGSDDDSDDDSDDQAGNGSDSDDSDDDSDEQDGGSDSDKGDTDDSDANADDVQPSNQDDQGQPDAGKLAQALKEILEADEDDMAKDLFEQQVKDYMEEQADDMGINSPDIVEAPQWSGRGQPLASEFGLHASSLASQLKRLMEAFKRVHKSPAYAGTKINTKNLGKIRTGAPAFVKKRQVKTVNTAVEILVDTSCSMRQLAPTARAATYVAARALEQVSGVSVGVTGFGYNSNASDDNGIAVIKPHARSVASCLDEFGAISGYGYTPLAEGLMAAGQHLFAQASHPRKIILVLTDGEPNNATAAKEAIELLEASGAEVMGIGIMHDVNHLFHQNVKIDDVAELERAMISLLENKLFVAA